MQLRLWDFHQDNVTNPSCMCVGPKSNVFALAVSASNRYIYSGGTDETVLKYDIAYFDSVRGITCHPVIDHIVLTASDDGSVVRHDGRETSINLSRRRAQDTLQLKTEITGVEYHPEMEHLFVTSDSRGSVCLRDDRMAFGPLSRRSQLRVVLEVKNFPPRSRLRSEAYRLSSTTREFPASPVLFLTATVHISYLPHYYPTVYSLSDPNPVAVLTAKQLPNGNFVPPTEKTYSNSCTMKHGSFGGFGLETDDLYVAGSDDFRAYVWKLPPVPELLEQRQIISEHDWASDPWEGGVAFTRRCDDVKCIPVEISRPLCRLNGHRSIVNTSAVHPYMLHVATAGIEHCIILHSPTPSSPCTQDLADTPTETRSLSQDGDVDRAAYFRALHGHHLPVIETDDPDRMTISMFDHILREEGEADVFEARRWTGDGSSSDELTDEVDKDSDEEIPFD
ncbi:WD40-repeat-containing domain protein [Amanita muscaria]